MEPSSIDWREEWISPGVCLIARAKVESRGWWGRVANLFMKPSGLWAYVHEDQAAIIGAPFAPEDADLFLPKLDEFVAKHQLKVKFVTASHLHLAHAAGLVTLLQHFQDAKFVYPEGWKSYWNSSSIDRLKCGKQPGLVEYWNEASAYDQTATFDLAGETLHFLSAPYHSMSDQLVVFRGFALLPDWKLPNDEEPAAGQIGVSKEEVAKTIERITAFENAKQYHIHQSASANTAEELRADFRHRLELAAAKFVSTKTSAVTPQAK